MKTILKILIQMQMGSKGTKAGNWLKAIAAVISFIAGLLTGNSDIVSNFFN